MESQEISILSSLRGDLKTEDYIQPHYKESYRFAIDRLVSSGKESYQELLKEERIGSFLSEEELAFITSNATQPSPGTPTEEVHNGPSDGKSSTGTYWPTHSDVETPDLDLGWPEFMHERLQTNIDLLFHPPRQNNPTIKEVIRRHIRDARQVIAVVMDMFTDVDIFKETVDASIRGVPVYVLLDDFHLKSFLTMAENQDVKIQQLRNMRVRTVKGLEYLCRSGAKFHGAMEHKFLLVDCQTVVYGSYSFMWSFEKINLSMVQVITGHLVQSYDEEFRTLYARSTVPAELCPPKGLVKDNRPNGREILAKYAPHSGQRFERQDQLRHTLDTVYRKTCERQAGMRDLEEKLYEEGPIIHRPLNDYGMGVQNLMPHPQSTEATDFLKRHSYAGERQDSSYIPHNMRHRASNWNISGDAGFANGRHNQPMLFDYSQAPQMHRGQHMRQSYHGNDKQVLSMQQNMPTLESTSKSFMRTWRIESYLKNPDVPVGDSCDYLDQYEALDNKASSMMHSRMRSSLIFKSTIPEQVEANCYINNSYGQTNPSPAPNAALHYSSMQFHPTVENRPNNDEFKLKHQSLQILDDVENDTSYIPGRNPHHSVYASLGRAKAGVLMKNPDPLSDSWYKRHSLADPRSNTDHRDTHDTSSHMYAGGFAGRQTDRGTAGASAQNVGYGSHLSGGQRSVSHYDVQSINDTKSQTSSVWQEPPSRTMSAAALDGNSKESSVKLSGKGSPHFLHKSSKKIRSLLNIPEKKEVSSRTAEETSMKSSGSTDTLLAENEEPRETKDRLPDDYGTVSTPRFTIDEGHQTSPPTTTSSRTQQQHTLGDKSARSNHDTGNRGKDQGTESRLYSRFEPFCTFDKKHSSSPATGLANVPSQEKTKVTLFPKGGSANEYNLSRATHGSHENKLGRFIQRVGNLIHKNK
ncbi:protein FAM83B [Lampris incognitus]|uniref:protein FAM83B n=1 Tax=Lampris incognitus TaxID=2546036 RepID=UPI0024B55017|nr:protein FAM83B [Lampris incognitus]